MTTIGDEPGGFPGRKVRQWPYQTKRRVEATLLPGMLYSRPAVTSRSIFLSCDPPTSRLVTAT